MPEGQSRAEGEQAAGQSRAQKEEVTLVLASPRYSIDPTGRGPLHGTAPVGALGPRSRASGKVGTQLGNRGSGKNGGGENGGDPNKLAPFCDLWGPWQHGSCKRRTQGGPWASSFCCLRAACPLPNSLPFYPGFLKTFLPMPICLTHVLSCCM